MADSGFQDRKNGEFIHNSMPATKTPANYANTFSTWFTLHALIGIESVLSPNQMARFNNSCSMGWGRAELDFYKLNIFESYIDNLFYRTRRVVVWIYDRVKK